MWSLSKDSYIPNAIELLKKAGLDFEAHKANGINMAIFGEHMFTSGILRKNFLGLALNKDIDWISFHGGYDFAYLYKLVTCDELPESEEVYLDYLKLYFPNYYDVKELLKDSQAATGSLSKAADILGV